MEQPPYFDWAMASSSQSVRHFTPEVPTELPSPSSPAAIEVVDAIEVPAWLGFDERSMVGVLLRNSEYGFILCIMIWLIVYGQ